MSGEDNFHILLKENPSKISILEEFLHGSQKTLGILDSMHPAIAEVRVTDFMLRHQTLLGLTDNDCVVLEALKQYEIARAKQYGFNSFEIEAKKWTNSSSK